MKILLISGHGAGDPGACANGLKEANLTVEMAKGIKPLLEPYATVDLYQIDRNAYKDIQNGCLKVNFASYDYVLEIHFNAGGGTGTEIYITTKEKTHGVEDKIVANLAKLGLRNRGVKVTDFLVIKTAKNRGVSSALLETCFIDSSADVTLYKNNKQKFYNAVANGIIDGFGLKKTNSTSKPTPAPQPAKKSVEEIAKEVLAGKWGNGDARKKALEKAGYNYTQVQNRVNELAKKQTKKSVDQIAKEVIAGKWGNGTERKNKLKNAGYNYSQVQKRVNELM